VAVIVLLWVLEQAQLVQLTEPDAPPFPPDSKLRQHTRYRDVVRGKIITESK
jgi:hypothetical protein